MNVHYMAAVGMLVWLVTGTAGCAAPAEIVTGTVELVDVQAVVRPDGGLDVRETLRLLPDEGRLDWSRTVHSPYADGVTYRSASVDGAPIAPGAGEFLVEDDGGRMVVNWRPEVVPDPATTLVLEYSLRSAVAVRQPRGHLEWPVLAAGRGFDANVVSITLDVPGTTFIYDGTGMGEAGWAVEVSGDRVSARREGVASSETATLIAVFDVDRSRVQQGEWEWNLDRQQQYRLALIAAGLFILVVGAGILGQLRFQYPPVRADAPADVRRASHADRQMLTRGLRVSGLVGLALAIVSALAAERWLSGLGPMLQSIPASIAIVSVWFLVASWWYGRHRVSRSQTDGRR